MNGDAMHIRETPRGPVLIGTDGRAARLSHSEATVLANLMAHPACSWQTLANAVWGSGCGPLNPRAAVGVFIQRLRLAGVGIVNVRGKGYALEWKAKPCAA